MERLGKNVNGYFGETINITSVLDESLRDAKAHRWKIENIQVLSKRNLLAFTRSPDQRAAEGGSRITHYYAPIYLSTGIHGDEPAGPLAIRQLLREDLWPRDCAFWICPCLNPTGFARNTRENEDGLDLNRQYLDSEAPETLAHIAWLQRQPLFDLCLCLHEDWESHGFYVYELNPDKRPSLAEPIVDAASKVCPVDPSELIEGRPARNGIIRPDLDPRSRPKWPEAFFLLTHKTRLSYTLEAPSDFPLATRVAALVAGVRAAIASCRF